jgi:hypothetical protein
MAMPDTETDVIDTLVGITPGSALDAIRHRRPEARNQAQASYRALFVPESPGGVTETERFAVAAFVSGLHGGTETASFYAARLAAGGASGELHRAVDTAIAAAKGQGPYGFLSRRPAEPRGHRRTDPSCRGGNAARAGVAPGRGVRSHAPVGAPPA